MLRRKIIGVVAAMALTTTALVPVQAQSFGDILRGVAGGGQQGQSDQRGSNNNAGTAAGCGIGGAILGGLLGRSTLGRLAIGAAVGLVCFAALSRRDNEALTARSAELLNEEGATTTRWEAPDSKKEVVIQTGEEQQMTKQVDFKIDAEVAAPQQGTIVEAKTYVVAVNRLNFRKSPTTASSDNLIGYFSRNDDVEVIGFTPDRQWALVGDEGVVVGYAAMRDGGTKLLLTPEEATAARIVNAPQNQAAARARPRARPRVARTPTATGTTRVANNAATRTVSVSAATRCKAVVATLGRQTSRQNGCALPSGQWAIA